MTEQEQKAFDQMREALERLLTTIEPDIEAKWENGSEVTQARDALAAANAVSHPQATEQAWRPIESAPKDGTEIIGCWPSYIDSVSFARVTCKYVGWSWVTTDYSGTELAQPTYWMPLPTPPEAHHE